MNPSIKLNDRHRDTLRRMFHSDIRNTSPLMSTLLGGPGLLSVPEISFMTPEKAQLELESAGGRMHSVRQHFKGGLYGEAVFAFPAARGPDIARKAGGRHIDESALSTIEQDVIKIAGHIVLNTCVSSLSRALERELACEAPLLAMDCKDLLKSAAQNNWVMFLRVRFAFDDNQTEAFVMLVLSTNSLDALRTAAERIARQMPLQGGHLNTSAHNSRGGEFTDFRKPHAAAQRSDAIVVDIDLSEDEPQVRYLTPEEIDILI